MKLRVVALLLVSPLMIACSSSEPESAAPAEPSAPAASPEPAALPMLGGCILTEPVGEVPEDLYQETDIVATDAYPPFTKKIDVLGLTLIARDDISDDFIRLVERTIREIFPPDEGLDLAAQERVLRAHYEYRAVIPMFVGQPDEDDMDDAWERTRAQNSVCDIIMQDVPAQVMEVVEHILHYVSDIGLHYAFPDEWGIAADSELAAAMDRAAAAGYYDVGSYDDIDEDEVRFRVAMQEFAYWVISTAWNLQEPYGPQEDEWTIRDAEDLAAKMPELWAMVERTAGRVMVAPSPDTLAQIGPTRAEEREQG